jgi:hypothetical protein
MEGDFRTLRIPARSILAALVLAGVSVATADQPDPAVLTAVDVVEESSNSCHISLSIRGQVDRVETARFGDGRFVFDLTPVTWDGPTGRVRLDSRGIHEYRFAQFSGDPPVTRFVVEVETGWTCAYESLSSGVVVACSDTLDLDPRVSPATVPVIAEVRGFRLTSPVAGLDAETLVDRSLGFIPRDMVRDGLPHFGAMRDDWIGKPRRHKGLDIYIDNVSVQAVADGKVVGTGRGDRAGGWATIRHGQGVETSYVHISDLSVKTGDEVARGQRIAVIDGAVGNAVQPQLHFELRLDERPVDPIPYVFELASDDLKQKITLANQRLAVLEQDRASRVRLGAEENRK